MSRRLTSSEEGSCMEYLSNELLLESYYKAIELDLSPDFINLIIEEMDHRNLKYKTKCSLEQYQ